ncbi:MAG TPA: hypothetical protein ENH28_02445 [Euryarchaeota archaeon]|nr:hypothetical protein [Euryarchaeota archaeon]
MFTLRMTARLFLSDKLRIKVKFVSLNIFGGLKLFRETTPIFSKRRDVMYLKKEYRTLRTVANFTSGFGWVIVGVLALIGLIIGWQAGGFISGVLSGVIFGVLLGIPFIVAGQMISVFLDQKELLEDIRDSLKKS